MNFLSLDVGSTCTKCQLFSESGEILAYHSLECSLKNEGGQVYVDIDAIVENTKRLIKTVAASHRVDSVCISTFGESFVLLDGDDNVLFPPMIYTDPRGEQEAAEILERFGDEWLFSVTGVLPQSMYSFPKLLWIKYNCPQIFKAAKKIMLICDYLGYLLTGKRVIDYGLAARTAAFDVEKKEFSGELCQAYGIERDMFSQPRMAGSAVGTVSPSVAAELGLSDECKLVLGSHDQVCTTVGAGVLNAGDAVDGMGTVECITTVFDQKPTDVRMGKQGYPCVPFVKDGMYCTYILNLSCGSVVNWLRKDIMHGYSGEEKNFFSYMDSRMEDTPTELLVLPYFGGASTPYQNINAKGAVVGLTVKTADVELYRAVMEGTAMEMRLNGDVVGDYGIKLYGVVATGGGANSEGWLQIKADIQNIPVRTLRTSEGGLCGCAVLQAVAMGTADSLEDAAKVFVRYGKEFLPRKNRHSAYDRQYEKYKRLYLALKEFN